MATILDVGILNFFVPILVLIFVFVILYGIFEKAKLFGEEKGLHALIAILFAFLFIIVRPLRELIITITPWFLILVFLIFIVLVIVMMLGFKDNDITNYLNENPGVISSIVVLIIIMFLLGLNSILPGSLGYPTEEGVFSEIRKIVFNPKILGFLLIMIIAYFVIRAIGQKK